MNKVIYQLTIKDVQHVAQQELGRDLSDQEVQVLQDRIANRISWYEAISDSIDEMLAEKERKS